MDEDLTLARRIVVAPCLEHADEAHARVRSWLAEIAGTPAGKTLTQLFADQPKAASLVTGIAEGSPHLWELMRCDPASGG